jgi:hypothetical protein
MSYYPLYHLVFNKKCTIHFLHGCSTQKIGENISVVILKLAKIYPTYFKKAVLAMGCFDNLENHILNKFTKKLK